MLWSWAPQTLGMDLERRREAFMEKAPASLSRSLQRPREARQPESKGHHPGAEKAKELCPRMSSA